MLPLPMMRDWARCLLAGETGADAGSAQADSPTTRVYEKLRQQLCAPVGVDGFHALASRALALAKSESPRLTAVQVTADGALSGFGEIESRTEADQDGAGVILIAQLLGLFRLFLGEMTTLRLLEDVRLQIEPAAELGMEDPTATGLRRSRAFHTLLQQVDLLNSVGESLEVLVDELPDMEDGLVSVAGNIRSIAAVLDIFAFIRNKSKNLPEDISRSPSTHYVM